MRLSQIVTTGKPVWAAIAVLSLGSGFPSGSALYGRNVQPAEIVCQTEFSSAEGTVRSVPLPNGSPLELDTAWMLFRFDRAKEALAKLDAAQRMVDGAWGWRLPSNRRKALTSQVAAFRKCVAANRPPALAKLTVHTFLLDAAEPEGQGRPAGAGASITIDDFPVGRTGDDGSLTVAGPPGALRLNAIDYRTTSWGEAMIDLAPASAATASIVLDPDKEVAEDSSVVLTEAVDDIIPATSRTFTLEFRRNGVRVPISRIGTVAIEMRDGHSELIHERFRIARGAIAAVDPWALFVSMERVMSETITLRVEGSDYASGTHAGYVRFRVGRWPLAVTLAPPPSNPTLPVARIPVGVSIIGAGIAVQRISDAKGRFVIESFPHATVAFDCVTIVDGKYYYGQATMVHSGQRSVTLMLRHVSDVVNAVPPLIKGPTAAAPRRR
jgi:hypothetical protein